MATGLAGAVPTYLPMYLPLLYAMLPGGIAVAVALFVHTPSAQALPCCPGALPPSLSSVGLSPSPASSARLGRFHPLVLSCFHTRRLSFLRLLPFLHSLSFHHPPPPLLPLPDRSSIRLLRQPLPGDDGLTLDSAVLPFEPRCSCPHGPGTPRGSRDKCLLTTDRCPRRARET